LPEGTLRKRWVVPFPNCPFIGGGVKNSSDIWEKNRTRRGERLRLKERGRKGSDRLNGLLYFD